MTVSPTARQQASAASLAGSDSRRRRRQPKPLPAEPSPRGDKAELRSGGLDLRGKSLSRVATLRSVAMYHSNRLTHPARGAGGRHAHYATARAASPGGVDAGGLAAQMQWANIGLPARPPDWIGGHAAAPYDDALMREYFGATDPTVSPLGRVVALRSAAVAILWQ